MVHNYQLQLNWKGNLGEGTKNYQSYEPCYAINIEGKTELQGSSDPAFRGNASKYNPEELFLASLSSCHMLWYLHLCSEAGVIVLEYSDDANGTMIETHDGGGQFSEVTLHPNVVVSKKGMINKANELHKLANKKCFIANSCNFPIKHIANCTI